MNRKGRKNLGKRCRLGESRKIWKIFFRAEKLFLGLGGYFFGLKTLLRVNILHLGKTTFFRADKSKFSGSQFYRKKKLKKKKKFQKTF